MVRCQPQLHTAWRSICTALSGVSPNDEVVELVNYFNAALVLFARQHTKLNVVHIVSCFTWAHKPRGWLIKAKGIYRIHGKVMEKNLRRELMTELGFISREAGPTEAVYLPVRIESNRGDEVVTVKPF